MRILSRKLTALAVSAAMVLSCAAGLPNSANSTGSALSMSAQAADVVVYNGDTMSTFSKRTPQSVSKKYADAMHAGKTYVDDNSDTYYKTKPSTKAPYFQGVLTDDTLKCMQEMTQFYRWLVGSKPMTVPCTQSDYLQYQALDRCFEWGHWISNDSKPADMPQELWDKGFECNHNILAWGYSPLGAITGWMNEGYSLSSKSWDSLGHRYALINPGYEGIQFGYCDGVGLGDCVYDWDTYSDARPYEAFYAFPSPGYFPAECIEPTGSAWNVDFDTDKLSIDDESKVTVTVTNLRTKKSYTCKKGDDTALVYDDSVVFVQPSDYSSENYLDVYKDSYKVVINGLTDKATSKPAQIQYTVKFFELKDYAPGKIIFSAMDYSEIYVNKNSFKTTESLKKLGAVLPNEVYVQNEFYKLDKAKVKGSWVYDEKNQCWNNSVDASGMPATMVDTNGMLKKLTIKCKPIDSTDALQLSTKQTTCGNTVRFTVNTQSVSGDTTHLVLAAKDANGNYYSKKTYDSRTYTQLAHSYVKDVYTIKAAQQDSGDYVSVCFYKPDDGYFYNSAYACNAPQTLTVTHNYKSVDTVKATCTEKGLRTFTCTGCGNSYKQEVNALGHKWGTPTYTWSSDYKTCTAKRVCANDRSHVETETVNSVYSLAKQPTCAEKGTDRYTAAFKNPAFAKQVKNVDIPTLPHKYGDWQYSGFDSAKGVRLQSKVCSECKGVETRETTESGAVTRLAGKGRYETAVSISQKAFEKADTVVLAYSMNYADALAGVPLAYQKNAPILLTNTHSLDAATLAEIKRLEAKNVIILGGEGVIDKQVEYALAKENITTQRIAGKTRYSTAAAIAQELNDGPEEVFLVYGLGYADALSVSPVAAAKNAPIIYLNTNGELNADTAAYLAKIKGKVSKAYVIGGESVITNDIMNKAAAALGLDNAERISGRTRFLTCIEVNKAFSDILTSKDVCIATGMDFPDALAGGVFAAINKSPLMLINGKANPTAFIDEQKAFIKASAATSLTIFGGTGAVPDFKLIAV